MKTDSHMHIVWSFLFLLCLAGIFLRCYSITDRPMHSDEGVNYHFVKEMMKQGYYHYSHKNYHGPTYFYLLYGVHSFLGSEEFFHRLPAILSGIGVVAAPLLLAGLLGAQTILPSVLLLALSSSLIYYSRYSIHEMFLVLCSVLFLIFFYLWMEQKRPKMLLLPGLLLGLLIATKETFIIFGFAACISVFLSYSPVLIFRALQRDFNYFLWGLFILILVIISFFSGFFQHSEGLRELFMGIPQWIGRGHSDVGHHKPYLYYQNIFQTAEPLVFLVIAPLLFYTFKGIYFAIKGVFSSSDFNSPLEEGVRGWYRSFSSSLDRITYCTALVSLISFLVYSYIPYKTPWLITNVTAPALFAGGLFVSRICKYRPIYHLLVICFFFTSAKYALKFNFEESSIPISLRDTVKAVGTFAQENPYSYVQTTDGMITVVKDIISYFEKNPSGSVLIAAHSYWPFPYYLREYSNRVGYRGYHRNDSSGETYGILVLNRHENWTLPGWEKKYFRLSAVQESYVYYREETP